MRHGKDYLSDKPAFTHLRSSTRRAGAATNAAHLFRLYSERLQNRATVRAGELVKPGAIGRAVQTVTRPASPERAEPARVVFRQARVTAAS